MTLCYHTSVGWVKESKLQMQVRFACFVFFKSGVHVGCRYVFCRGYRSYCQWDISYSHGADGIGRVWVISLILVPGTRGFSVEWTESDGCMRSQAVGPYTVVADED